MKSNKLIDMADNQQINAISSANFNAKQDTESLTKTLLIAVGTVLLVGTIFITTPYFMKILPGSETQVILNEPHSEKQFNAEYAAAFVWTVKLKLEDLKLNHRLQASINNDNKIHIEGNISVQEELNWKSFLKWYNGKKGFPILLHSVEAIETEGNIPELKSVWFGINPTAYFSDGRFGNIGTVFEDGWKIVSIEAWAVFIERDGTMITLAY